MTIRQNVWNMKRLFSIPMKYAVKVMGIKWYCLFLLVLFSCSNSDDYDRTLDIKVFPGRTNDFSMWQLEPFFHEVQMGYILRTDNGKIIVVDGGGTVAAPYLEGYLQQLGGTVDTWIVTHAHMDHVGALLEILDAGTIGIGRLLHAPPDEAWVRDYEAFSAEIFSRYITTLQKARFPLVVPGKEAVFELGEGVHLEVISAGLPEITENAINNSSLVFKISSRSKSVLFLGDMGVLGGNVILEGTAPEKLAADYVQMAHHGQHGVGREFYMKVGPQYALWPTPEWLWENRADGKGDNTADYKTPAVRRWMGELKIKKNYVSGLEGTVQID